MSDQGWVEEQTARYNNHITIWGTATNPTLKGPCAGRCDICDYLHIENKLDFIVAGSEHSIGAVIGIAVCQDIEACEFRASVVS